MDEPKSLSVGDLARLVSERRRTDGLSLREAATDAGVSFNTLARIERGRLPDLVHFVKVVAWLGLAPESFFNPPRTRAQSTPEIISWHLRSDRGLSDEAATKIAAIVLDLYSALVREERSIAIHLRAAKTFEPEAANLLAELLNRFQNRLTAE